MTAFAGLSFSANQIIYLNGSSVLAESGISATGLLAINVANKPALKALGELSQSVTASSSSLSIDLSQGWNIELTLSASVTSVAFTNLPASGILCRITLDITSTGSYTMSGWPGTTRWPGGTAYSATASGRDTVILATADGGSTYRGYVAAYAMS